MLTEKVIFSTVMYPWYLISGVLSVLTAQDHAECTAWVGCRYYEPARGLWGPDARAVASPDTLAEPQVRAGSCAASTSWVGYRSGFPLREVQNHTLSWTIRWNPYQFIIMSRSSSWWPQDTFSKWTYIGLRKAQLLVYTAWPILNGHAYQWVLQLLICRI